MPFPKFSTAPIYVTAKRMLDSNEVSNNIGLGYELCEEYQLARLSAMIRALGCRVIETKPELRQYVLDDDEKIFLHKNTLKNQDQPDFNNKRKRTGYKRRSYFPRDPVITLSDKGILLTCNYYGGSGEVGNSKDILNVLKDNNLNYQVVKINDPAYFEGGNTHYLPKKQVLLHNSNPVGHYGHSRYKKFMDETNKLLQNKFDELKLNIKVIPIDLNLNYVYSGSDSDFYYYHLDCFMQALPDGRLVLLNSKFLTKACYENLKQLFGDKLIDLNINKTNHDPRGIINFLAFGEGNETIVISSFMDNSIVAALQSNNIFVITPDVLDPKSQKYNLEFADKVAEKLREDGYVDARSGNLFTHISVNINGYNITDGSHIPADSFNKALGAFGIPLQQEYQGGYKEFVLRSGGPHCLALDIAPGILSTGQTLFSPTQKTNYANQSDDMMIDVDCASNTSNKYTN